MNPLWSCLILLTAAASSGASTNDLLAFFPLRSDASDAIGHCPQMQITNVSFVHGVLYLNGVYAPLNMGLGATSGYGYHAIAAVPGLKYESFTISLDFFPLNSRRPRTLRGFEAKLNDWSKGYYRRWLADRWRRPEPSENFLTGGTWYRWIGFNPGTNGLEITLNNQAFRHSFRGSKIRVGEWHNLICSLDLQRKQIITILDGHSLETVHLPENFQFEVVSTPRESGDKELTFVNYSNGNVFNGYAAHLRIFSRALSVNESTDLYSDLTAERKSLPTVTGTGFRFTWFLMLIVIVIVCVLLRKTFRRTTLMDTPANDTRAQ